MNSFIDKILKEAETTLPPPTVIKKIKAEFPKSVTPKTVKSAIKIKIKPDEYKDINNIFTQMDKMGWYPSSTFPNDEIYNAEPYTPAVLKQLLHSKKLDIGDNITSITQVFEPEFADEYKSKTKCIYHATPASNVGNILKKGLIPSHHDRKSHHPDRIYCAVTEKDAYDIASMLANNDREHELDGGVDSFLNNMFGIHSKDKDKQYAIFAVYYKKLENVKWYKDINYKKGVYTNSPIPVSAIKLVKTLNV